jgi:spermidine/putrescine transport system substrate-binding protein
MSTKKYFWFCLSLLLAASMILTACAPQATPPPAPAATEAPSAPTAPVATEAPVVTKAPVTGSLIMLDWASYEAPDYWTTFAKEYPDVKVDFSFMSESADAYAKMKSGFKADTVHPCSNFWKIMADENMLAPLDTSKMTNWKDINPSLAAQGAFNGKQYWAPYDWGFESILVRKDLVKKVPESWADLWDPQYKGHIAFFDSGETAHIVASRVLGFDPWKTTPEQDAQIKQKLLELMPNVLTIWSSQTELEQMIASGDVWVAASAWNASYINMLNQGLDVVYLNPKEGRMGYLCGFAIPATSTNYDLALAMIDAYLNPESQAKFANDMGYGISNNAALPMVKIDSAALAGLGMDNPDIVSKTTFYQYLTPEQRQAWTDVWSEVKTSK